MQETLLSDASNGTTGDAVDTKLNGTIIVEGNLDNGSVDVEIKEPDSGNFVAFENISSVGAKHLTFFDTAVQAYQRGKATIRAVTKSGGASMSVSVSFIG